MTKKTEIDLKASYRWRADEDSLSDALETIGEYLRADQNEARLRMEYIKIGLVLVGVAGWLFFVIAVTGASQ